jgi:hypothetical protein
MTDPDFDKTRIKLAVCQHPENGHLMLYDILTGRVVAHQCKLDVRGPDFSGDSVEVSDLEVITDRRIH